MRIRLIDIDSKIPNLALMKLSAYHKARGDSVSFDEPDPDRIYASVVFKQNAWKARGHPVCDAIQADALDPEGSMVGQPSSSVLVV